jgi:hypothetical protein
MLFHSARLSKFKTAVTTDIDASLTVAGGKDFFLLRHECRHGKEVNGQGRLLPYPKWGVKQGDFSAWKRKKAAVWPQAAFAGYSCSAFSQA